MAFPSPDFGPNIVLFPTQKLAKASHNGENHSQILSSTFRWKFHEDQSKNSKVTDAWKFA